METVHTNENAMVESGVPVAGGTTAQTMGSLMGKVIAFSSTPDDTFKRKLDLIEKASDMSTEQKLEAMNQAEGKHITNKVTYCLAGLFVCMVVTPEGRKVLGSAAKSVATTIAPLYNKVAGKVACYFVLFN